MEHQIFPSYHLPDFARTGPKRPKTPPYASIAILDPIITIERRHSKYYIAARFNIETAILNYSSWDNDGRELFFQDICLQYKSAYANEDLFMKPESDPSAALTVSRGFSSSTSATVGATLSQTLSGNVSLGLTRSRSLTVEYAMTSWNLSAHRVFNDAYAGSGEQVRYQWFWAGTQDESRRLSPDLRHAVKRHVVVKRIVPEEMVVPLLPVEGEGDPEDPAIATRRIIRAHRMKARRGHGEEVGGGEVEKKKELDADSDHLVINDANPGATNGEAPKAENTAVYTWDSLLDFSFSVQVRVKKRLGRLHRLALFSSNEVRGQYLRPAYTESFRFRASPSSDKIPKHDTADISALLNKIKEEYEGKLDELPEKDLFELAGAHIRREIGETTQEHVRNRMVDVDRKLESHFRAARSQVMRQI
ncbi:hypothetical protein BDW66DRAFT_146562 [Aspergillus desertorum]